jgi:hypothetical protein
MSRLIKSAKFWLLVMDITYSSIAFFMTLWMRPDDVLKAMGFITSLQPIFIMIIKAIADEDVAAKEAAGWADRSTVLKADVKALTTISEDTPK